MKSILLLEIAACLQLATAVPVRRQNKVYNLDISQSLQSVLDAARDSDTTKYPTDLTRDIFPKPVHSHNDYWRDVPFFSALSVGCESVEADVWLYNGTLYVGHETLALTPQRTFDSLYIQPILSVLNRQNPRGQIAQSSTKNGVFDTTSDQTLYLWVDVKTDGATTWPYVVRALEPLRQAGYLTSVNGTTVTPGTVTVIGTGNTPLNQVQGVNNRDYFFDANIDSLNATEMNITSSVSPIASADFASSIGYINGTTFSSSQLETLRSHIALAKSKGIGVRYWDTPYFPISKRNAVWQTLTLEGVALLNADDLPAAAGFAGPAGW